MKFVRENPTLAFGLGLPLIIVAVFLLASVLPGLGATPPRYSVVFATNYNPSSYPGNRGIAIRIENRKATVVYVGENPYYTLPRLYLYDPAKGSVREIPIQLPPELKLKTVMDGKDSDKITRIFVSELDSLTLDNSSIAPDGYEFLNYDTTYPHDLLTGIFYTGSYRNGAALKKGNYKLRVPQTENDYGNTHFIGWVIPQ